MWAQSARRVAPPRLRCAPILGSLHTGGVPCVNEEITSQASAFEVTSKRRKGFPSETRVKRGVRVVGGYKQLIEKLGRNDPCPCRSGRRFQTVLHARRGIRRIEPGLLFSGRHRITACAPKKEPAVARAEHRLVPTAIPSKGAAWKRAERQALRRTSRSDGKAPAA